MLYDSIGFSLVLAGTVIQSLIYIASNKFRLRMKQVIVSSFQATLRAESTWIVRYLDFWYLL